MKRVGGKKLVSHLRQWTVHEEMGIVLMCAIIDNKIELLLSRTYNHKARHIIERAEERFLCPDKA